MPLTWNAIFLGTGPDNDTDETTVAVENAFVGVTVGNAANPISSRIQTFSINDADGNNLWNRDNGNSGAVEVSTLTIDGVDSNVILDSVIIYNATITYEDNTTANVTAVTFQLNDGRVFVAPEITANADNAAYGLQPIDSITLNSLNNTSVNLVADRQAGNFVPCFVRGTRIETPTGEVPIEALAVGDLVMTADHGAQPVRWIGRRTTPATGPLAPIRFREGALGARRPFLVSPQHRMLLSGWRAMLLFGEEEVLAPAKALINDRDILREPDLCVEYIHLLFDRHEIIYAEGVPSESFHVGDYTLSALGEAARTEVLTLFPELACDDDTAAASRFNRPARPILRAREARVLALA